MTVTLSSNTLFLPGTDIAIYPATARRIDFAPLTHVTHVGYDEEDEEAGVITLEDDGTADLTPIDGDLVEGSWYVAYQSQQSGARHQYVAFRAEGLG